jgi:hypothetical protein
MPALLSTLILVTTSFRVVPQQRRLGRDVVADRCSGGGRRSR